MTKKRTLRKIRGGGGACGKGNICHINDEAATELGKEVLEDLSYLYNRNSKAGHDGRYGKAAKAIKDGADLTISTEAGLRAIDLALLDIVRHPHSYDNIELIYLMLESRTVEKFINLKNGMGHTPLEMAIDIAPRSTDMRISTMIERIINKGGLITKETRDKARLTLAEDKRGILRNLESGFIYQEHRAWVAAAIASAPRKGGQRKQYTRKYSKKLRKYRK